MPASDASNRATHSALHIRNAHEAHTLFEAVRLGHLPIVRRRLSPTDRELQSGEVFVWEEASYKGGLERWTDGRKWSQSRMREPFLFYEEKVMPSREEKDAKAARRARKSSDPGSPSSSSVTPSSPSPRRQDRPTKVKGLTKQTYSAFVTAPGSSGPPKKWHLTAYFCSTSYHELPVVTDDPILRTVVVPPDVYVTGKGLTRKNNTRGVGGQSSRAPSRPASTQPGLSHSAFESSASTYVQRPPPSESTPTDDGNRSRSPWSNSSDAASTMPITPPQLPTSLPAAGPTAAYLHHSTPPSQQQHSYFAPQPHHFVPQHYIYETAVPPSPIVVIDSTPRPASTLPPLMRSAYDEQQALPAKPHIIHSAVPPPPATPASFPGPYPQHHPHRYSPSGPQPASVSYPSSDVRGEYYQPSTPPATDAAVPGSPGSQLALPRYSARHSLDQRALGAFRLAL